MIERSRAALGELRRNASYVLTSTNFVEYFQKDVKTLYLKRDLFCINKHIYRSKQNHTDN